MGKDASEITHFNTFQNRVSNQNLTNNYSKINELALEDSKRNTQEIEKDAISSKSK